MKRSIVKIAVPTLALGLAFAPIANAAPNDASHKTEVSAKKDSKTCTAKADSKAKNAAKKETAKEKEASKKLAPISKNISKVEASVTQLTTATTDFYTKAAAAPVSVKAEADFYARTSGKLKANTNQLKALKKQLDHVSKKYKGTDTLAAANKKIADLNSAISAAGKGLTDFHTQFTAAVKDQEAKKQFTAITDQVSKVEAGVIELSKAYVDFYTKAAADSSVTAQVEADFYTKTSASLQENTKQLAALKGQLDLFVKKYGSFAATDVTAAYAKITAQTQVVGLAVDALNTYHANFKPVPATPTGGANS